jgi:hypothetical protein
LQTDNCQIFCESRAVGNSVSCLVLGALDPSKSGLMNKHIVKCKHIVKHIVLQTNIAIFLS